MEARAEPFLKRLFDGLWKDYRGRVAHAAAYEKLVADRGGVFRNDHVAFRTFAAQHRWSGIAAIARPFEALGYRAAGAYDFPDKRLSSLHFAPPSPELPKLFVSELRVWELSPKARRIVLASTARSAPGLGDEELAGLAALPESPARREALRLRWAAQLSRRWPAPKASDAVALERESQFGAWTLLHGHTVNHFTAAVDGIEREVAALKAAGVPMKPEIEGAPGSKLRQSSTQAVVIPVEMRAGSRVVRRPWTYAYFELAERPLIDGRRFEGFLGGQASNLFDMTKRS